MSDTKAASKNKYLVASILLGFTSLLYQTYCIHILFLYFPRSSEIVSLAIGAYLSGLAVSGILYGKFVKNKESFHIKSIASMQIVAILLALLIYMNINIIPLTTNGIINITGSGSLSASLLTNIFIFLYLFLPALSLGGCFPLLNGLYISSMDTATKDVSYVYFWDLAGSVFGCILTGYLLIPHFGITPTILIAISANLLILILVLFNYKSFFTAFIALSLFITFSTLDIEKIAGSKDLAGAAVSLGISNEELNKRFQEILYQENSSYGLVTISRKKDKLYPQGALSLNINLRSMCSHIQNVCIQRSEEIISEIAAYNLDKGSNALNIGLGCGNTAKATISQDSINTLDVVEINPKVIDGYNKVFDKFIGLNSEKNLRIINDDGAKYIKNIHGNKSYDSIIIDIEEIEIIYSSPLYTKEYMEHAKSVLKPGGVYALWSFYVSPEFAKILYNTVSSVFEYAEIIVPKGDTISSLAFGSLLVFGSDKPIKVPEHLINHELELAAALNADLDEINTIEKPILQQYYDGTDLFGLPESYKEPFAIK
jgi:spermidine synthase